jgi:hypothetical protein
VLLNEVLPAPKDVYGAEWVELYNPGDVPIDLSGWSIDDSTDGRGHVLPADSTIAARELLIVELAQAILNNSGDTVRLLGPDGSTIDSFAYLKAPADRSFSRSPAGWSEAAPSPGEPNPAPEPDRPIGEEADQGTGAPVTQAQGQADTATPQASAASTSATAPTPPLLRVAPALLAGAVTPAPTYVAQAASPTGEPDAGCAHEPGCGGPSSVGPEATAAPIAAPPDSLESAPAAPAAAPVWPAAAGIALIVTAAALFVIERTPRAPESEEDGVL